MLKIVSKSASRADKNGKDFITVRFSTPNTIIENGVTLHIKPKEASLNLWEESYLDGKPDFGYNLNVGQYVQGEIVTRIVEPYEIPDTRTGEMRTVSTRSLVVLGDSQSENWEQIVDAAFERAAAVTV
jgi:hypothetical protein